MPSLLSEVTLSPHDTYVLARALVGLEWHDLPCSPLARLILSHVDISSPDDLSALRRLLGPEGLRAILSVDPEAPLPEDDRSRSGEVHLVPDLPESARLTPEQQERAADVGRWLDEYIAWASTAANETPLCFHEGAGLWLGALGEAPRSAPGLAVSRSTPPAEPPLSKWQAAARQVVEQAEETLWSVRGEQALEYLTGRGLDGETIRGARLGVVPGGYRQWRTIAGLSVPCGITIPWISGETLWVVKVRRAAGQPKYAQIAGGSSSGLYRGDALQGAKAVLFCEGEFDTLVAHQAASDLVAAVSLGSAGTVLSDRWIGDLVTVPLILVAYDVDRAGVKGAARLQALSQRVHVIRVPYGKDITEYHLQGGDVFTWLSHELRRVRQEAILRQIGGEK